VVLIELGTAKELLRFKPGVNAPQLRFSPDSRLLGIGASGTNVVWEVATGRQILSWVQPSSFPPMVFSPDSKYVASQTSTLSVQIRALAGGSMYELTQEGSVNALEFSPDGKYLATANQDNAARIWDIVRGREVRVFPHGSAVASLRFSADGRHLATGAYDATARWWEVSTGRELRRMTHEPEVLTLAISPDSKYLATGGAATFALLWYTTRGGDAIAFQREPGHFFAVDAKGSRVAFARRDQAQTVTIMDVSSGRTLQTLALPAAATALEMSADGRYLAAGGKTWDLVSRRELAISAEAFSVTGSIAAARNPDRSASVWDLAMGRELGTIRHNRRMEVFRQPSGVPGYRDTWGVARLAISPDAKYVASSGDYLDHSTRVWDTRTYSPIVLTIRDALFFSHEILRFSPDGTCLALAQPGVWLWRTGAGPTSLQKLVEPGTTIGAIAFSRDSRYLAAAAGALVHLWDLHSGKEVASLRHAGVMTALVYAVAFSSDGRYLATGSRDGYTRVWEVPEGREISRMSFNKDAAQKLAFAAADKYLIASGERSLTFWLWRSEDLISEACGRLLRNLTEDECRQYMGAERYRKTCENVP
jgi:WD40 repeat protein